MIQSISTMTEFIKVLRIHITRAEAATGHIPECGFDWREFWGSDTAHRKISDLGIEGLDTVTVAV